MKHFQFLLVGFICVLVTSIPVFHSGWFRPHDFTNAARIVEMNRALARGEFPVRWSENFGFGYGMPLFNFYAPLPYYVAQIPYALTHDAILSIKFLYVLNGILAFFGMYLFAKELWGQSGGTVSAMIFSLATYRALDLYVRGDIGEVLAMSLIPLALYGILKKNIWITGVVTATILLTHNLTGMITLPVLFVFGYRQLPKTIGGLLLGFSLSAFYTLPAYFEKNFTRVAETITTGYFDYHNHFVAIRQFLFGTWGYGGSQPGLNDGISFALGWLPIVLFLIAAFAIFVKRKKINDTCHMPHVLLLLLFLFGSLFMATDKSVFIWDHIQVLKFMQFPWRFLALAHVFLAAASGAGMLLLKRQTYITVGSVIILIGLVLTQAKYFLPETYLNDQQLGQYYATSPEFIRRTLSETLNDYLPKAIHDDAFPAPVSRRFEFAGNRVKINVFQFPGWVGIVDGKPQTLEKDPNFPIYQLTLPTGTHNISVQLQDTPIRKLANSLSGIGIATLFIWGYQLYGRRKYRSH